LDIAEAGAGEAEAELVNDLEHGGLVGTADFEGDHGAETSGELALGVGVVGVVGEAGIVDALDAGMGAEPSGELGGVGALALHAQGQGLEAAEDKPGFEWAQDAA